MKIILINFILFLYCILLISCKKEDSTSLPSGLVKVTMSNGGVIYVAPLDSTLKAQWGPEGVDITTLPSSPTEAAAKLDFNGKSNTEAIIAQLGTNNGTPYAAKICADLVAYGFDDWYLPSAGELFEMYRKLGPIVEGGSGQLTNGNLMSSSEVDDYDYIWNQRFHNGSLYVTGKSFPKEFRCVRK